MSCRSLPALALALLLAACASPLSLKPGTSIEEARAGLGRPTAEFKLPDGGTRYHAQVHHVDAAGRDAHAAMGFEQGWSAALDQLVELVQHGRVG